MDALGVIAFAAVVGIPVAAAAVILVMHNPSSWWHRGVHGKHPLSKQELDDIYRQRKTRNG